FGDGVEGGGGFVQKRAEYALEHHISAESDGERGVFLFRFLVGVVFLVGLLGSHSTLVDLALVLCFGGGARGQEGKCQCDGARAKCRRCERGWGQGGVHTCSRGLGRRRGCPLWDARHRSPVGCTHGLVTLWSHPIT